MVLSSIMLEQGQENVDKAMSPSQFCTRLNAEEVIEHHVKFNEKVDLGHIDKDTIYYGKEEMNRIDIIGANSLPKDSPVFVFIHGGMWQAMAPNCYHFISKHLYDCKVVTILAGYELAPKVSMEEMVEQIKQAFLYILAWGTQRQSRGIYFCGHSAGAHLLAMAIAKTSIEEYTVPVLGHCFVSGLFDLEPVQKSYANAQIKMSRESAVSNSPINMITEIAKKIDTNTDVLIVVGEEDTPEFVRQSEVFAQQLKEAGKDNSFLQVEGVDHFNIIENFSLVDYVLLKEIKKRMSLK